VNTNSFNARRYLVALHVGYESYFQTIKTPGDGDAALRCYLNSGGTLLVLPSGPFPLYYSEAGKPANGAAVVGLNIGAGSFERPPAGASLTFRANTNQTVMYWPESAFPFPSPLLTDQRWRPSRAPPVAGIRYTPLVTLFDDRGGNHGDGAAVLEFTEGPLRGGRVIYVWFSLLADRQSCGAVVRDLLKWALAGKVPAASAFRDDFEGRAILAGGGADWTLHGGQWKLDQGTLVGQDSVADGYEIKGVTLGSPTWGNYAVRLRFKVDRRGSDWRDGPWFGVRCRPDGDGYYLTFTDRDCQLHKIIYGVSTSDANCLARSAWKPDEAWHQLKVTAVANRLKAELDGRALFAIRDDSHLYLPSLRSGLVVLAARRGSRAQGSTVVRFDDVVVELMEE
jgi:hypothetical protein